MRLLCFQDYFEIVETPMDLTTVMSKLDGDMYHVPNDFANDVRLIFTNSKNYNTNKRSRVSCKKDTAPISF